MAQQVFVGKPVPRIEGTAKVTGEYTYVGDVKLPRMVHAKLLRSPYPHARIRGIDRTKAEQLPGVFRVVTAADLPPGHRDPSRRVHSLLAEREVLFAGQPVAAVLAVDPDIAEEALDLIEVTYEELPAVFDPLKAMEDDAPLVRSPLQDIDRSEEQAHATMEVQETKLTKVSNVTQRIIYNHGDVQKGFAEADIVIEQTYRSSMFHQGYIEPQCAVADYGQDGELTVWASAQGQFNARTEIALLLGLPETKVRVIGMEPGGAFGAKSQPTFSGLTAALAMTVRRPVRLVFTRREDLMAANPVPQSVIWVKTGVKKDGLLTAIQARAVFDCGAFPGAPVNAAVNCIGGYYRCENIAIEGLEVLTNKVSIGSLRAPGTPQGAFALESQMDIMARQLGLNPIEFRLRNAVEEGDLLPNGRTYGAIGLKACLERIAASDLWHKRTRSPNRGYGVAVGGWQGGLQPASAAAALNTDGTVSIFVGSIDLTGTNTAFTQIAADELRLPLSMVQVRKGDTGTAPFAGNTGGSKTLRTVGAAVQQAAQDVRAQILAIAAERLDASIGDLEWQDGTVSVSGSTERSLTYSQIATMCHGMGASYAPILGRGLTRSLKAAHAFAVEAVEVEVNPDSGVVSVWSAEIAQDVGFAVNPLAIEGQIQGAVGQGLGMALWEELMWDEHGGLRNASLLDYRMPTSADLPLIDTYLVEVPADEIPFGARGVGEPPIVPGMAAVANAVEDAIGIRITEMPITPERILRALGKVAAGE